jgi:phosphate uptake regulator
MISDLINMSERRKIMSLGSSFVISIPKPWIRINTLGKGDFVFLETMNDGSLVVHPTSSTRKKITDIHLNIKADESENSVVRRVIGSYLNGYNKIRLTSEKIFTNGQQKAIREIVSLLYMMILESESRRITLQTLIDETKTSILSGVERMYMITFSMLRDALVSMEEWDKAPAESILSLENDVDQLMFYLLRLIRLSVIDPSLGKQLFIDPLDFLDYQTLVHRIERIADHTIRIAKSMISIYETSTKISENLMKELIYATKIGLNSYDDAVKGFIQKKISSTNEIINNEKEIEDLFSKTISKLFDELENHNSLYHLITMWESIIKITHYTADIAELTIDKTCRII